MELPLISYALYLLLYDTNQSKNPYFPYWNYQKNLERLNDAECKAEFRFIKYDMISKMISTTLKKCLMYQMYLFAVMDYMLMVFSFMYYAEAFFPSYSFQKYGS